MQFLFPGVLWGLLALAVPIVLHLFHFRRYKKVYFTNVKFLQELKDERSATRNLRNLLVLLARCAAIAGVVLAFAQPYIGGNDNKLDQKLVSVFVDNSYSMEGASKDAPLIDKAKRRARDIVSMYKETDRFQVLTHDFTGLTSKILSQDEGLTAIDDVELTPKVRPLKSILAKQQETFKDQGGEKSFFMISDFQKSITDLTTVNDTTYNLSLIPIDAVASQNITIDTAYFTAPTTLLNQTNALVYRATNYGEEDREDVVVSIFENEQKKPAGTIDIKANQTVTDTVNLTFLDGGDKRITLEVRDYPIQFDDKYHIVAEISPVSKVLAIYDNKPNRFLGAMFAGISEIKLDQANINSLNYSSLKSYSLIITEDLRSLSTGLVSELKQYVNQGGNVLVFPSRDGDVNSYNSLFSDLQTPSIKQWLAKPSEVFDINMEEYIFSKVYKSKKKNVDLPKIEGYFGFQSSSSRQGETLLSLRNGTSYLSKYKRNAGHLYVCSGPMNRKYSDLVEYAEVFVPMVYKMTYAKAQQSPSSFVIGKSHTVTLPSDEQSDNVYTLTGNDEEAIPQQRNLGAFTELNISNEVSQAGFYNLKNKDKDIKLLAFNFDRAESDPTIVPRNELQATVGENVHIFEEQDSAQFLQEIKEKEEGVFLWRWCLIFALIFLAIETLLLRFWK